jgi:hypothetical protein
MDNQIQRLLDGLAASRELLTITITPEAIDAMTPEQLAQYEEAMKLSSKSELKKKADELQQMIKNVQTV